MIEAPPLWQRRYRAPIVGFPTWSRHAPDRLVYTSSESGVYQLHSWDLATGERRQITDEPVGLVSGHVSADGEWVVFHLDPTGSESGTWMTAPFRGGAPEALADRPRPFQIDERIHQTAKVLEFLARNVPGIRILS